MTKAIAEKVAVDTNFLVALLDDKLNADDRARLDDFIAKIEKGKGKLIVPMPVLAEFLAGADHAGLEHADALERRAYVEIAPFDRKSATECALLESAAFGRAAVAKEKGEDASAAKKDSKTASRQKVKVDRQIVAIAKAFGAKTIISNDGDVRTHALRAGISHLYLRDLPLPPSAAQGKLDLAPSATLEKGARPPDQTPA
ncbi:MAG: PIN domain-containing protein [Rhizobacter sp.]|nr:PIN domain-containing protein [Rhizobacter sp.]